MYGYIYITENLINHKKYIGQKKGSFKESYKGSGTYLKHAFDKYGKENFECHILEPVDGVNTICETKEELDYAEWFYIEYYNCVESDEYYNLKPGGSGGSPKGLLYLTNVIDGSHKKVFENKIQSYLDTGEWIKKGPLQTEETIRKRTSGNIGKKHSKEWCENIGKGNKGKKKGPLKEETKDKIRSKVIHQKTCRKVQCIETGEIYFSVHEAARQCKNKTNAGSIIHNIKGKYKSAGGYTWRYVD